MYRRTCIGSRPWCFKVCLNVLSRGKGSGLRSGVHRSMFWYGSGGRGRGCHTLNYNTEQERILSKVIGLSIFLTSAPSVDPLRNR